MAEYKIRKGGKEFTAKKLSTLVQLAERGLIRHADPIQVDGGAWRPAGEMPELSDALPDAGSSMGGSSSDLWKHFADEHEGGEEDGLLKDFLAEVNTGTLKKIDTHNELPAIKPTRPRRPPSSSIVPGGLSAVMTTSSGPRPTTSEERLPMVDVEPLDDEEDEAEAAETVAYSTPPKLTPSDVPVSFTEWMEKRDDDAKTLLEGFGRYDDGIVIPREPLVAQINWWRVVGICGVAAVIIVFRWMWVTTVAEQKYPLESEIVAARQPAAETGTIDVTPAPSSGLTPHELFERTARGELRAAQISPFNTPAELEDVLFFELANRGVKPSSSVKVESLHAAGTQDVAHRRPTKAKLQVQLQGVGGEDAVDRLIERLTTTWLLLGKYQTEGKVTFVEVRIEVGEPTPFGKTYESAQLAQFYAGNVSAEDLFLEER